MVRTEWISGLPCHRLAYRGTVVRYPTQQDIEEMRARGYDVRVIAEQIERANRGETAQALKTSIRKAFAGVTLGAGIGLGEASGLDDCADEETRATYRALDQQLDWGAIQPADLNRHFSSLSFFDAEGMRFHIPAYLIADLDGNFDFDVLYSLTLSTLMADQFALLNADQRGVIRDYLRFMAEEQTHASNREHIQTALAGYWSQGSP